MGGGSNNTERLDYTGATTRGQCSTPNCPPWAGLPDDQKQFCLNSEEQTTEEKPRPHSPQEPQAGRKKSQGQAQHVPSMPMPSMKASIP